jgi:hypothetical protein
MIAPQMADLVVDGHELVVRLSLLERLGALRGSDVRLPLTAVARVRVTESPWREVRGIRAPGTGIPWLMALCTLRGSGFRDFAAIYGRRPAVVVEATGAQYQRLVISRTDADAKVRMIEQAVGLGRPT